MSLIFVCLIFVVIYHLRFQEAVNIRCTKHSLKLTFRVFIFCGFFQPQIINDRKNFRNYSSRKKLTYSPISHQGMHHQNGQDYIVPFVQGSMPVQRITSENGINDNSKVTPSKILPLPGSLMLKWSTGLLVPSRFTRRDTNGKVFLGSPSHIIASRQY